MGSNPTFVKIIKFVFCPIHRIGRGIWKKKKLNFFSDYMQNILCLNSYEVAEWEESCLETMRESVSENSNNTCRLIAFFSK